MQQNYTNFTEEQLLQDPGFINWVKYHNKADDIFWNELISNKPSNLKEIQSAALKLSIMLSADKTAEVGNDKEQVWNSISNTLSNSKTKVKPLFYRWMAAASIVVICALLGLYMFNNSNNKTNTQALAINKNNIVKDIEPGGNKAILQLADGSTIILDSANNGNIANQGQTKIIKIDGKLAYAAEASATEVLYNTISTPRGGQYQIELADGTRVWLNAASSLRFTTNFVGEKRMVELTGEAYFEVAKNAAIPFIVNVAGREEVEVLGTHFNINAYKDEPALHTTLLEGKVKVTALNNSGSLILSPGEQAQLPLAGKMQQNKNADLDKVMAWKNNIFNFNNENIESVMRQLSRWYDVDVRFEGKIPDVKFSGEIGRNLSLKQVLSILEETRITYKLEGKNLIIGN